MNKADLLVEVQRKLEGEFKRAETRRVLELVFDTISEQLARGERVRISGFGVFEPRARKARPGRHPVTGKSIQLHESHTIHFRASEELKQSLAESRSATPV